MSEVYPASLAEDPLGQETEPLISSAAADLPPATAGGMIRNAREAAGLHIAALAVALKVPVKKLEALEADRFDLLPDAVFVRALASSVCRTLKIDSVPVLLRLPQTSSPKLIYQGTGINTPFRAPSDGPGPSVWTQFSRPAVIGGLALLLAAVVLIFLPALKGGINEVRSDLVAVQPVAAEPARPLVEVVEAGAVDPARMQAASDVSPLAALPASASASRAGNVLAASTSTVAVSVAGASTTTSATVPIAAAPLASASASAPVSATGIVVFTAKSQSWVEVTDSRGQVVLRRTLAAGEVAGASGALPLAAIVGKADVTQVQVRGKAFDLTGFSRDNVARFEVK